MPEKDMTESTAIEKKPNKSRLAFLLRYLMDRTDEDHALSIYEIMDAMEQNGYGKVTRKTATVSLPVGLRMKMMMQSRLLI